MGFSGVGGPDRRLDSTGMMVDKEGPKDSKARGE